MSYVKIGEHSHIDGGPVLRLTDTVVKRTLLEDSPLGGEAPRSNIPGPQQIRFELTEANLGDIEKAKANFNAVKSKQKLHAEPYSAYGKNVVRNLVKEYICVSVILNGFFTLSR